VSVAVRFDDSLVSRIQQASDIVEVISEHLALRPKGKEMVGLCPFHKDTRPSLNVSPSKQIFKCFACGAGGTVFTFVQLREGLTFPQAVERLAQRAGIEVKPIHRPAERRGVSAQEVAKLNAWAMNHWRSRLAGEKTGLAAREYAAQRGISAESIRKWSLGYAPDAWSDLVDAANRAKISAASLLESGLAVRRETGEQGLFDKFRNRLMFPIVDVTGKVVGFGGRTLGQDQAKYMNSPATVLFDKSNTVYGLNQARHSIVSSGTAVVVEGYMDCLMCHQYGLENVVATLGTSFTANQARLLRRYANQIVLLFDSDTAGEAASSRALEICLEEGIDIKLAFVPHGKDPCDFVIAAGAEALRSVIDGALDVMDFKWRQLKAGFQGGQTLVQRTAATREFVRVLAAAFKAGRLDRITRGLILNRVASLTGLSAAQLENEVNSQLSSTARTATYRTENAIVMNRSLGGGWFAKAQQEVIEVLLNEPSLVHLAAESLSAEDFDVPALKEVAAIVFSQTGAGKSLSLSEVLSRIESPDTAAIVVQLQHEGEKKGNFRERLVEAVKAVLDFRKQPPEPVQAADEETRRLMTVASRTRKRDLRNVGMK
jgi:DNA primase